MSRDVDDLLHRDAAMWRSGHAAPPSLDDALDRVLQREPKPTRRLQSLHSVAAIAASIIVVAALAAGFAAWRVHRSPQSPAGPSGPYPSTVQYRGETLYANPGRHIDAVVVDRSRPRNIAVVTSFLDPNGEGMCLDAHPVAQVLTQSATTLSLDLITYKRKPPGQLPKTYRCGFASYSSGPPVTQVPVALAQPLSPHAVIRDAQGAPAATVDPAADPPTPARVPSGYTAGAVTRADPAHGRYAASRAYRRGANILVIRAGYLSLDDSKPTGARKIGRYLAVLSHVGGTTCVSWTNAAGLELQVCAGETLTTRMTDVQLVDVARSLR